MARAPACPLVGAFMVIVVKGDAGCSEYSLSLGNGPGLMLLPIAAIAGFRFHTGGPQRDVERLMRHDEIFCRRRRPVDNFRKIVRAVYNPPRGLFSSVVGRSFGIY